MVADGEKKLEDMVTLFYTLRERDKTDGHTPRDGIGRAYA